jgi:fucose permease
MDTTRCQLDAFVLEHILKPRFWILGAFIIVFWIMTLPRTYADTKANQHNRLRNTSKSRRSSTSNPTSASTQPVFTARVSQFLTTRLRKGLVLTTYAVILGAQLLESYWVAVTLGRWTTKLFLKWPDHGTWVYGVYCLSIGVMLMMDVVILTFCCFVVLFHVVCISELVVFRVPETVVTTGRR